MILVSVTDVVEAGVCPRRYALVKSGAPRERPHGPPVGALIHGAMTALFEAARGDAELALALAPERPGPDDVAARAVELVDATLIAHAWPRLDRFRGDDLQRAGRILRALARLVSTYIRRARAAGAAASEAVARTLRGAEGSFALPLATPAGPATLTGRFDLLIGNELDGRLEVWELKSFADDDSGSADEQAALYVLGLAATTDAAELRLRPAVLHVQAGEIRLRAVPPPGPDELSQVGERVASMERWRRDAASAPATSSPAVHCVSCQVRAACWAAHGPTLPVPALPTPPASARPAPVIGPGPRRAAAPPPEPGAIFLGHDEKHRVVSWAPNDPKRPLDNFGFLVTGDPGSGKTQTLSAIIAECRAARLPVLVFDFKNDFGAAALADAVGLRVHDVRERGLPYNPLTLLPQGGRVRPRDHVYRFEAVLTRVLGLGVQQGAALNRALQAAYVDAGISLDAFAAHAPVAGPSFADVVAHLEGPATLEPRLRPLVDLRLLRSTAEVEGSLADLLAGGTVIDVHGLPIGHLGDALVELMLLGIHAHIVGGDQPRRLTRLLVLDEAHRVAASASLHALLREGRAFGLGCAIGTQFPDDLDDELAGSLATKLFLRNDQDAHRAAIARHLVGATSGPEAAELKRRLRGLDRFEGYFVNAQNRPYRRLKVVPYHERSLAGPKGSC
jgi:hypothetical protein